MSWVARGVGSLARWAGPRAPLHRAPGGAAGLHTAAVMMATVAQRLRLLNAHRDRKFRNNWKEMMGCPQRKGVVLKVVETSPRKPNSGKRRVAWLRISMGRQTPGSRRKKYKRIRAHIPGIGNHNLQTHSQVLFAPKGRMQDIPSVKYKCIRGALDLMGCTSYRKRRSKFGTKKPKD